MDTVRTSITSSELLARMAGPGAPLLIDVRRTPAFFDSREMIDGALRRDPDRVSAWARTLPQAASVVVYCVHGHAVSQGAAGALNAAGREAWFLEGGIEHWKEAGHPMRAKPAAGATRWITRERPKIDRIACPWLIERFIDPEAEFHYVPKDAVKALALERDAVPYDIADVEFTHVGEMCSFDALLRAYRLEDPALQALATIVRGADTGKPQLSPQSAGLLAISQGLSELYRDDHEMLGQGKVIYDALYAWCRQSVDANHSWSFEAGR